MKEIPPSSRWGLGGALSLRFAQGGYHVALLARRKDVVEAVAEEVRNQGGTATSICCDVTDMESVSTAFKQIFSLGKVEVMIYNVAPPFPPGHEFPNLPAAHDIDPQFFDSAFNIGVTGCLRCNSQVVPKMIEQGKGTILLSGATASLRGGKKFGSVAPVKAALRSYGQSLFQELAAQGVHVGHVIIDGVIESPNTKGWGTNVPLMDPAHIAEQYWNLHVQPRSVWSYEIQISPSEGSVGHRL